MPQEAHDAIQEYLKKPDDVHAALAYALSFEAKKRITNGTDWGDEDFDTALKKDSAGALSKEWAYGMYFSYKLAAARPDDSDAQRSLGEALLKHGETDDALEALERAVSLSPNDAYIRALRGEACIREFKLFAGCSDFAAAVKLDKDGDLLKKWNAGRFFLMYCSLKGKR